MVEELFATPGAGQESEIFAFASDVDADQRIEIERMAPCCKELSEMRSAATGLCVCRRAAGAVAITEGARRTAGDRADRSARRAEAGLPRRRRRPRATWSWSRACRSPRASSIRRRRPAQPTPPERAAPTRSEPDRMHRRRRQPTGQTAGAGPETPRRCAGAERLELRQLGSRVQRQPRVRRQLQRLQHLRHRERRASRS